MSQRVPEIEGNIADVKESATGKASNGLMQLVSFMLINESLMGKTGCTNPGVSPARKNKVKRVDQDGASDEEGRLSAAEESTVAGSLTVSPTLSCSVPSIDSDQEEELSDLEQSEHEVHQLRQSLGDVAGFCVVGRRLARVFAEVDDTSSDEFSYDEFSEHRDDSEEVKVDVMRWQEVGKRLSSLAWLDLEDSDLED
jgi:hypothetical protein